MIKNEQLRELLEKREPHNPRRTDWRKMPNGRIVRFIDWEKEVR